MKGGCTWCYHGFTTRPDTLGSPHASAASVSCPVGLTLSALNYCLWTPVPAQSPPDHT